MEENNQFTSTGSEHPEPTEDIQLTIETVTPDTETAKVEKDNKNTQTTTDQKQHNSPDKEIKENSTQKKDSQFETEENTNQKELPEEPTNDNIDHEQDKVKDKTSQEPETSAQEKGPADDIETVSP